MCWISDQIPSPKIASEDITCYKVFCNRDVVWEKIKFLGISLWKKHKIKGLYSLYKDYLYTPYSSNAEVTLSQTYNSETDYWYIEKGYHSYSTLDKAELEKFKYLEIIVKCIIPKGAEYYINEYEDIVSSNIIITDKIID